MKQLTAALDHGVEVRNYSGHEIGHRSSKLRKCSREGLRERRVTSDSGVGR